MKVADIALPGELWQQIADLPGYYVSNFGRTFREPTLVRRGPGSGVFRTAGKLLKPTLLTTGYLQITTSGRKKANVHRLVAMAFCDGRAEGLVVNHRDGNKQNNRAENLEWVTHSENQKHSYRELGKRPSSLGKYGAEHHTSKAVVATCLRTGERFRFPSGLSAIRSGFGTDSGQISRCCHNRKRSHSGYQWSFADQQSKP